MDTYGTDLPTHFASPERDSTERVRHLATEVLENKVFPWFDAMPMGMALINERRQIVLCNSVFSELAQNKLPDEILGLRPGEALNCVNAELMEAGCGCSDFCNVCGAANAIVKSLNGHGDCQECRLLRIVHGAETPLDIQVFTTPVEYNDHQLVLMYVMDVSHELRMRYLNRVFYHGLISGLGGMNTLSELIEAQEDSALFPLLIDTTRHTLADVMYHRDIEAAEQDKLKVQPETFDTEDYLKRLIKAQCNQFNIQENVIRLENDCATLTTDKRLLRHVLRNLLNNALEARLETPGPVTIVCSKLADGRIALTVTNNGEVLPKIRKQMFKRYVSTKSRDRGLGTYVVKLLTTRYLNGEVLFTSANGITTFTVILPAPGRAVTG